jgi:hypothetical protein
MLTVLTVLTVNLRLSTFDFRREAFARRAKGEAC